jgi:hypothetical protein
LRYRRPIGAENVRVFADIKKKHSAHAITADVDIVETAKAAEFFQANGVIVSGVSTGQPADVSEVEAVSSAVSIPTLIGSGITPENIGSYSSAAAFIVGSSVKQDGLWENLHERIRVLNASDRLRWNGKSNLEKRRPSRAREVCRSWHLLAGLLPEGNMFGLFVISEEPRHDLRGLSGAAQK